MGHVQVPAPTWQFTAMSIAQVLEDLIPSSDQGNQANRWYTYINIGKGLER